MSNGKKMSLAVLSGFFYFLSRNNTFYGSGWVSFVFGLEGNHCFWPRVGTLQKIREENMRPPLFLFKKLICKLLQCIPLLQMRRGGGVVWREMWHLKWHPRNVTVIYGHSLDSICFSYDLDNLRLSTTTRPSSLHCQVENSLKSHYDKWRGLV